MLGYVRQVSIATDDFSNTYDTFVFYFLTSEIHFKCIAMCQQKCFISSLHMCTFSDLLPKFI